MTDGDRLSTQRDVGPAVVAELCAAGFDDAEEIGRGGFGIVFRCTQSSLDRVVAVKVLIEGVEENRERFVREQRAMGRLTGHPNIVGVLQVGETASGYPYLVMQYHRRGSLEQRIRRYGALPLEEALRVGVKVAGALESAHRVEILHRDIKPGNILYSNYGEPALSDFGIAHIVGGFQTATGIFTGSPAFSAPETLSGDPPTRASDVYSLGSTLFCALTGHAAFERRSGEQVVAQFLRIATESAPDIRAKGIPDDVATVIEMAMSRDPRSRPSAVEFGDELRQIQARHGLVPDEMAFHSDMQSDPPPQQLAGSTAVRDTLSNLPAEVTSFVGRRAELADVKNLLVTYRLVTLTGIGGVGKTRLALQAARDSAEDFVDGVRLVELGDLRDGSLLADVVAEALSLRDDVSSPLTEVLADFLHNRNLLLVLDNCEQVVDVTAKLAESLLRACPELRILATSRENLGIAGEAVLPLNPMAIAADHESTPDPLPEYDAVALFAERAAAAVPSFQLTQQNRAIVSQICARLDGLPLAIELAAARLRAMSLEQILERLADRFTLLTRGSRRSPARQQTLRWSVEWSYDLCTAAEQQLWGQLSVFAGSFGLEAAEYVCGDESGSVNMLDTLTSLVEKSILIRTEANGVLRFRLLDTLRMYGLERMAETFEQETARRRHRDWYRTLTSDAAAGWFSSQQIEWIRRLDQEVTNLREAMEFNLAEAPETAHQMSVDLCSFWVVHGLIGEGRRWLDRGLAAMPSEPTLPRIYALFWACCLANLQGDRQAAAAHANRARDLVEPTSDTIAHALVAIADGYNALVAGDPEHACRLLCVGADACDDLAPRTLALLLIARAYDSQGDIDEALTWNYRVLALTESHGESVFCTYALWSIGVEHWRRGERAKAGELLRRALQIARELDDVRTAASCLEVLAWIAADDGKPLRAVTMLAAADSAGRSVGNWAFLFPNLPAFHQKCAETIRATIGAQAYDAAYHEGRAMKFIDAVSYALAD